jgi:hypothetical protein
MRMNLTEQKNVSYTHTAKKGILINIINGRDGTAGLSKPQEKIHA